MISAACDYIVFPMAKTKSEKSTLSTVVTASRILELIGSAGSASPALIARTLGLTRSNVHRLLATLNELGYVEEGIHNTYNLTFRLFELGNTAPFRKMIIDASRPSMLRLAQLTGLTINNAVLYQNEVLYVDKVEANTYLKLDRSIGSSDPVHCTSLGKVLLAFHEETVREAVLAEIELFPSTPNTITDMDEFRQELEKVRAEGYALDAQELTMDLNCIAIPVFNTKNSVCSALSVSGPSDRFTPGDALKVLPDLLATGREVTWRLEKAAQAETTKRIGTKAQIERTVRTGAAAGFESSQKIERTVQTGAASKYESAERTESAQQTEKTLRNAPAAKSESAERSKSAPHTESGTQSGGGTQ